MYKLRYGSKASEMALPNINVRSSPFELTVSNDSRSCDQLLRGVSYILRKSLLKVMFKLQTLLQRTQ
jgi:hypothetical protein